ncbi:hypothetical protein JK358_38315 [Nocardia sp. 2]|uniref:Uncharacterized protein n=1 Tax=Nocardia acididurans TaxID=2802282 RepID=A0ABS1MI16_9NOCA|nr:hypothetical protein [Nocardia acididurans]MBL1080267.1 hypothetical protein [Nocardia acididurans]
MDDLLLQTYAVMRRDEPDGLHDPGFHSGFLHLLGLSDDMYTIETFRDKDTSTVGRRARFSRDIRLAFRTGHAVDIDADDALLLLRAGIFDRDDFTATMTRAGFRTVPAYRLEDSGYAFTVCQRREPAAR